MTDAYKPLSCCTEPIGFMNNAHYKTLLTNNALDDTLARRIEAFKSVAASS